MAASLHPAPATGQRDATLWPFATDSPWNTPLGRDAAFAGNDDPRQRSLQDTHVDVWINAGQYSQPIVRAKSSDPMATFRRRGCDDVRIHVPLGATPAAGSDKHLNVIDPTGHFVDESWLTQGSFPNFTTGHHVRNDLYGPGVGLGGSRAYGGSAIGGLIRTWEVQQRAIHHALALAVTPGQLAHGPVWPATADDGGAQYTGAIHMGELLALPADVDLDSYHLSPAARALADALAGYGAYVVDSSVGSMNLYADPGTEDSADLAAMRDAFKVLRPVLRVIVNNGRGAPGGPGPRRAAAPPPL